MSLLRRHAPCASDSDEPCSRRHREARSQKPGRSLEREREPHTTLRRRLTLHVGTTLLSSPFFHTLGGGAASLLGLSWQPMQLFA